MKDMPQKKLNNIDFRMVKRLMKPKPKPLAIKREVVANDILLPNAISMAPRKRKELPRPVAKVVKAHEPVIAPVMKVAYAKFSLLPIVPVIACFLLLAMMIQSVTYLTSAKSASGTVLGSATSAYDDLDAANRSLEDRDFTGAKSKFSSAQQNLALAQSELDKFKLLSLVAPPARSADDILTGAYFLAEAGKNLTYAMQLFDELSVNSEGISTDNYAEKLEKNRNLLKNSLLMITYAEEKFESADSLPGNYAETVEHAKAQIRMLKGVLTDLVNLEDLFLSFFGSTPKTYLLVFQNYDEIRATGGFLGTYGVLKYENGSIKKLKIESIYNLDGSLTKQIAAPGPFQPEIKKWGMRDANWFADFPTSAKKILTFFETESETADGLIALTPQIFVDILKLVGPIEMPGYDVTLNPENFQETVQEQTSVVYDKELNQPKKFLDDFAPIMLDRLSNLKKEQWFEFFQIVKNNFTQKHVLVYSADQNTQAKISSLGFDGKILDSEFDYLSVINSNHGGTKTDLDIKQKINIRSQFNSEGEIINTLKISRDNTSDLDNKNFVRVLVPKGSILLDSYGFASLDQFMSAAENYQTDSDLAVWDLYEQLGDVKIRTESGKTEFTGWVQTGGQSSSELMLVYKLPFVVKPTFFSSTKSYSLLFQKQAGNIETQIEGEWDFGSFDPVWSTSNSSIEGDLVKFNKTMNTDEYFGAAINK